MAEKKDFKKTLEKLIWVLIIGIPVCYVAAILIQMLLIDKLANADSVESILTYIGNDNVNTIFIITLGAGFIFLLLYFTADKKNEDSGPKGDLENVHWLDDKALDKTFKNCYWSELKNFSHEGIAFKTVYKRGDIKVHFTPNFHSLIVGTTGSGKGTCFVEPNIQILSQLKNKPSLFITDPKGELFAHHSQKLKNSGYNVLVLDLMNPYNSRQWNPLEGIYLKYQRQLHLEEEILKHTNDDIKQYDLIKVGTINNSEWYEFDGKAFATLRDAFLETEVEKTKIKDECIDDLNDIATALSPVTDPKNASWEEGARNYILAVLIAMLEDSENPQLGMTKEKYNFYNMYKIVMNREDEFAIAKGYFSGRSPISKTVELSQHIVNSKANVTRDSYMSTLGQKIALFSDNGICYLTSGNDIDFYTFDDQPTAFFIKIPDEKQTRYGLASICVTQSYKNFVKKARDNEVISKDKAKARNASLKRPIFYIMDEFANMPKVNNLEGIITVARSRKIFLNMIIQSYAQLENVYGKATAGIVMDNCNTKFFLGTTSQETRETFSKELGNYQVKVTSKSKNEGEGAKGGGSSTQLQSRPLMYPSDLDKLKEGNIIVKIFGNFPINSQMYQYWKAPDIYKIGQMDMPFIPGKRLNEEEIFYDIKERNRKVLNE